MAFRPGWAAEGACRATPGVDFFDDGATAAALAVCAACPVRAECLDWALSLSIPDGVFGGRTARQRRRRRRTPMAELPKPKPRARMTAYTQATAELRRRHHAEFEELFAGARRELGIVDVLPPRRRRTS